MKKKNNAMDFFILFFGDGGAGVAFYSDLCMLYALFNGFYRK